MIPWSSPLDTPHHLLDARLLLLTHLFRYLVLACLTTTNPNHQEQKQRILDKYGGSEHLDVPDARLLVGQTESYVEYDRTGRVVKGAPKVGSTTVLTHKTWFSTVLTHKTCCGTTVGQPDRARGAWWE